MSYANPASTGRQLTGFIAVILLHVVMVYALVYGLARKIVEVVHPPLETKIIEEVKPPPPDKPPPPPPPKFAAPPPPYIPPPEIQVQVPQAAPTITAVTNVKPTEPVPPPGARIAAPSAPVRVAALVDAKSCEKPPYPAASLRAAETGVVRLSFLIGVNGLVLDSKVERSSGYPRLDEAARNGLKQCRFRAATVDGKAEQSWARIEYAWKIE
jgi:periplasmic protein TonB